MAEAHVEHERRVELEGALNCRDVGGYVTTEGRRVRRGQVFRSDALHALTDADRHVLAALGLRVVWDLRRDVERERAPSVLGGEADGLRTVVLPIGDDDPARPETLDLILAGELAEADDGFMIEAYASMVDDHAAAFATLLAGLADPGGRPALFHCTAGKDRTGLAAALLLLLLDVPEDVVLDDYELSTVFRAERRIAELRPRLEAVGVDVERVRPFLSARRPVLESALARIAGAHGTVERYLVDAGGLAPEVVVALRRELLE